MIWLGVGLAFCAGGFLLGFGRWAAPGPGFFPVIIGGILCGLSVAGLPIKLVERFRRYSPSL